MAKLASSQMSRQMGQRLSGSAAMLSTCCGGLGGAGDVESLPVTASAAAAVALEKKEKPGSLAGLGRGGRSAQVPQEGNPPSNPLQAEVSPPSSPLLLRACLLGAPAA